MTQKKPAKVFHSELWGLRQEKYEWLLKNDIKTTKWKKLSPKSEFYLFVPREEKLLKRYETYPKVTDVFPVNSVGVVTARDGFAIDGDMEKLKRRIRMFRDEKMPDEIIKEEFGLRDTDKFELKTAREKVREDVNWQDSITKILYRPFDVRWIYYSDSVIERPRREVMRHMLRENLGLITRRQMLPTHPCNYVFVSDLIIADGVIRSDNKGSESIFPLYLYKEKQKPKPKTKTLRSFILFEPEAEYEVKRPNISPELVEELEKNYSKTLTPEEIFHYIYAVLYSNTYRRKYAEFLKMDFPRIPFTNDYKLFKKMSGYGQRLVDLHLMKSPELEKPTSRFQGKGENKVEKPIYNPPLPPFTKGGMGGLGRIYINGGQYFEGISLEVWGYQIGGYQVCAKWLKDRKGRILSLDEIKTYCKAITSIKRTIEIQKIIDGAYEDLEQETI